MKTLEELIREKARNAIRSELDGMVGTFRRELNRMQLWIPVDKLPKGGDSHGNPTVSATSVLAVIEDAIVTHHCNWREDAAVKEFFDKIGQLNTLDAKVESLNHQVGQIEQRIPESKVKRQS